MTNNLTISGGILYTKENDDTHMGHKKLAPRKQRTNEEQKDKDHKVDRITGLRTQLSIITEYLWSLFASQKTQTSKFE